MQRLLLFVDLVRQHEQTVAHIDVVNLGLVYTIDLDNDGICLIEMTLTTMGCPLTNVLADMVVKAVREVLLVAEVKQHRAQVIKA